MNPAVAHLFPETAEVVDGRLAVGGCDLVELADRFGTPLFVYDETHLRHRCRQVVEVFGDGATYASKAFLCRAMARLAYEEGMALDVASAGEMALVLSAGVPPARVIFHGNNKSIEELTAAVEAGVGRIVVDSLEEIDRLESLGSAPISVLLRLTPGVVAATHEHIATGHDDSKFGFTLSNGVAVRAVERVMASDRLRLRGLHCHVGSQIMDFATYAEVLQIMAEFANPWGLEELVMGGGLGVGYTTEVPTPDLADWARRIRSLAATLGIRSALGVEPGRSIVATAGLTLYRVGTIKDVAGVRTYVSVDGGMSDNPRPIMYGAEYEIFLPRDIDARRTRTIRLVGKHCESGDILVREGMVPEDLAVGDVILTPVTGAYGFAMASNYNRLPRPAVVFVKDGSARLVVRRETIDDMMATDVG